MKKKMTAVLMSALMAASMIGCGSQSAGTTTAEDTTGAAETTASTDSTGGRNDAYADLPEIQITFASSQSSALAVSKFIIAEAERIEESTGGKLKIKVAFDGTLGNDSELVESCMAGSIPMILLSSSAMVSYIPEMAVFDMPMVFKSGASAYEKIPSIRDTINEFANQKKLQMLYIASSNMRSLTSNKEIKTPEDFKGLNIRTLENSYHMAFWKNMGANPTPLAFSELYLGLQQGLVDAQDNPIQAVYAMKFHEVQDYYMDIPAFASVSCYVMNLDYFYELPEAYKNILDEFIQNTTEYAYNSQKEQDAAVFEAIGDQITVLNYTDDIAAVMEEAAKPIWDMLRTDLGDNLVDAYRAISDVQ